jgi:hypothetical protein
MQHPNNNLITIYNTWIDFKLVNNVNGNHGEKKMKGRLGFWVFLVSYVFFIGREFIFSCV